MKNTNLIIARMKLGLTSSQLAERVGITRQTMYLIENGKYNPSLKICVTICKALGKTLNELFWEDSQNEEK